MIYMLGFDHNTANMQTRELYAITEVMQIELLHALKQSALITGCAVLATCNRLELYVSGERVTKESLWSLVLSAIAWQEASAFAFYEDREAVQQLMQVSAGLHSQIRGEDQILSQVKHAIALAREQKTTDAALETLFRLSITAGKAVRSQIRLEYVPHSAAETAVQKAESALGTLAEKHVLVIGNGEMGRLACELFRDKGAFVTVTLRTYRKGETIVPFGCDTVMYDRRYDAVAKSEIVLSATKSPHQTIILDDMQKLTHVPALMIDLALPRDIEESVSQLTVLWDLDDLQTDPIQSKDDMVQVSMLLEKYIQDYYAWASYRQALPEIRAVEAMVAEVVQMQMPENETAYTAAEKAVHILLASMKGAVTPSMLEQMMINLQGKSRKEGST